MTDIARALQSLGATDWALDGDDIAGLTWLGGEPQFTTEQILAAAAALPPLMPPITRRQLRLTLLAHGLLDQIEQAVAALSEPARSVALIEWQDARQYERDHPLIAQIGASLALSAMQIDAMWAEAAAR